MVRETPYLAPTRLCLKPPDVGSTPEPKATWTAELLPLIAVNVRLNWPDYEAVGLGFTLATELKTMIGFDLMFVVLLHIIYFDNDCCCGHDDDDDDDNDDGDDEGELFSCFCLWL